MRLIDANDYRKRRCRTCINRVQCDNGGNLCFDIMVLNTCPTIEAEPVKYGRWVGKHNSFPQRYFCTECGGGDVGRFAFCHHCGARMRMDGDDE